MSSSGANRAARGKRDKGVGVADTAVGGTPSPALAETGQLPAVGFARGDEIGRFVVLEVLGEGGMGVVYAAYDPSLDRKVAIKLLRPDRADAATAGRQRLVREAKALAQLAHDNVVTVHEVGKVAGQVFIAMEYVPGGTLRSWVETEDPDWDAIVDRYVRAGRGLSAAHRAGLVHRDFKPENVLVGEDGRIRVTDFGLVGSDQQVPLDPPPSPVPGRAATEPADSQLTQHGVVIGTPGYIAPEVYRGQRADAASDQFAFCVSLYEALHGEKPFDGDNPAQVSLAVAGGRRRALPAEPPGPTWLAEVVERGLSVRPEDRFPSMDALLEALDRTRVQSRSTALWLAGGFGLVAAGAILALALTGGAEKDKPCTGAKAAIDAVWGDDQRAALRRSFAATRAPFADDAIRRTSATLDAYADAWAGMHTATCEKTRVRGEQSETLLDRRMLCLDRRRDELDATVRILSGKADAKLVEHAAVAASGLVSVDVCADVDALTAVVPPPERADVRKRVRELEGRLRRVMALSNAGKPKQAIAEAKQVVDRAATVGWPHLSARAAYWHAKQLRDLGDAKTAEQQFLEALPLAAEARDDRLVAQIYAELLRLVGYEAADFDRAMRLRPSAQAAVARAGNPPTLQAHYRRSLGAAYDAKGQYKQALALYRKAHGGYLEARGKDHPDAATALNDVAVMLDLQGHHEQALAAYKEVLATETSVHGEHHPRVARTLNNMAVIYVAKERYPKAIDLYTRAISIWRRAYGDAHPMLAITYVNLAVALEGKKDYAAAESRYKAALALWKGAIGRKRAHVATVLNNLGDLRERQGDCKAALPYFRRSLTTYKAVYPKEHPDWAYPLLGLGTCLAATGDVATGVANARQALAIRQRHKVDASDIAQAEAGLARALWLRPASRGESRRLATAALARYRRAGDTGGSAVKQLIAWMTKRDIPVPAASK